MTYDMPPRPHGTPEEQIDQLYRFLYQLTEKLNVSEENNRREKEINSGKQGNR